MTLTIKASHLLHPDSLGTSEGRKRDTTGQILKPERGMEIMSSASPPPHHAPCGLGRGPHPTNDSPWKDRADPALEVSH